MDLAPSLLVLLVACDLWLWTCGLVENAYSHKIRRYGESGICQGYGAPLDLKPYSLSELYTWLRITPIFRKRYEISFRFRQKRARNNAEITRNRALFSEITKNTANFDDTIYRNTQPRLYIGVWSTQT